MNPASHFRLAEQLDEQAIDWWANNPSGVDWVAEDKAYARFLIDRAQVHATLALAGSQLRSLATEEDR